ncbi:hypothetical protein GCM10028832_43580 [Streptomyces sparsus]
MYPRTADLWHHYGRARHAVDRAVYDRFRWTWRHRRRAMRSGLTARCEGVKWNRVPPPVVVRA